VAILNRNSNFWYYDFCILADMKRQQAAVAMNKGSHDVGLRKQNLAVSQQLGLLVFRIAGMVLCIALCWCWQCLLTVGGNLLPHTVTPWDVTTWHNAADRLRTFYTLLNAHQQLCKHHSDSGQPVSSLPPIALEVITVCVLKIGFVKHNLLLWFFYIFAYVYLTSVSIDSLHYVT